MTSSSSSSSLPCRKLAHLPLRPSTLSLLDRRGFVTTSELEASKDNGGMSNLAHELGCEDDMAQAARLWREVQGACSSSSVVSRQSVTALSLLSKHVSHTRPRHIVTFSKSIDSLLGGGIAKSEVTEVVGLPGVGKTQLAMQLCVDARLPHSLGGVEGESVYIDTEGSLSPERCATLAHHLVDHVRGCVRRRKNLKLPEDFTVESLLEGIHVWRVHDEAAQAATLLQLPDFLKQRQEHGTPVQLIIVDSIAFHYRCAPVGSDYMGRTRSLTTLAAFLADVAQQFDVAVVVTNQMTTKVAPTDRTNKENSAISSKVVPALGESWAHATTTRLLLRTSDDGQEVRSCTLLKSPHKAAGTAHYQVQERGIRDVPPDHLHKRQRLANVEQ